MFVPNLFIMSDVARKYKYHTHCMKTNKNKKGREHIKEQLVPIE